jgi:hypothetical protein
MDWEKDFAKEEFYIRWASKFYKNKFRSSYFDKYDFFGEGVVIFAVCFNKWIEDKKGEDGFSRYFRSALHNGFKNILTHGYASKRGGNSKRPERLKLSAIASLREDGILDPSEEQLCDRIKDVKELGWVKEVTLDSIEDSEREPLCDGGFNDVLYKELVSSVRSRLNGLSKKIFVLLVNPPQALQLQAIRQNRKKMKVTLLCHKKIKGMDRVRITGKILMSYLNDKGYSVTESEYYSAMHKIKKEVKNEVGINVRRVRKEKRETQNSCGSLPVVQIGV